MLNQHHINGIHTSGDEFARRTGTFEGGVSPHHTPPTCFPRSGEGLSRGGAGGVNTPPAHSRVSHRVKHACAVLTCRACPGLTWIGSPGMTDHVSARSRRMVINCHGSPSESPRFLVGRGTRRITRLTSARVTSCVMRAGPCNAA